MMQTHSLKKLDDHFVEAQAAVSNSAAEINDRVTEGEKDSKKRKAREDEDGGEGGEGGGGGDAEQSLEELREKVDRMTQRMEESMRKLIDGRHSLQSIRESVDSISELARTNASTQASTQARTQTRRRRATMEDGDEADDEDEDYHDFEPTDPAAATQTQASTIERFKKDMDKAKTRYQSHSMHARYTENNEYREFRKVVHDAQHHDDGVPLAHQDTWFPEGERPAPGVTTRRARAEAEADDSDDDIAVSRATVSTKCPLTLQEFKNPLTSTKCPHSFESEAILQMIAQARPVPVNAGARPEKAVQCPVSGCSKMLTKADLQTDNVLIRKIRRLQEAARLEAEESDNDDGGVPGTQKRGGVVINDEDEDGADVDDIVEGRVRGTQIKGEPVRSGRGPKAGGGVVDLAGDSGDEEAEEGEGDDEDEEMDE